MGCSPHSVSQCRFHSRSCPRVFQFCHLGQTAAMTLSVAESRGEKCLNQFPGERMANHEAAEANHVHVVVLDALVCGKCFMDQARPDARHFVRDDRCPDTASTNGHAAIHLPASDCPGQRHDKIRIIIAALRLSITKIDRHMTSFAQSPNQILL